MSNDKDALPVDWRAEAIKFCETALRNWPGQLRIHEDVVNDIADALSFRDQQTRIFAVDPLREKIKDLSDELELSKISEEMASRQHDKREVEIASLTAELARFRSALEQIAAEAFVPLDNLPPYDAPNGWREIAVERINIARAAISEGTDR